MRFAAWFALTVLLVTGGLALSPALGQTVVTLEDNQPSVGSPAFDAAGNLLLTGGRLAPVEKLLAADGYLVQSPITSNITSPSGVAVDAAGNVFFTDYFGNGLIEIPQAGGYATVVQLNSRGAGEGIAMDGGGNIFMASFGNNQVLEFLAAGGYQTVKAIGSGFSGPEGIAIDQSGNVFVANLDGDSVTEILASGGYQTVKSLGSGFAFAEGIALDQSGNVFVADGGNHAVKEILAAGGYVTVQTLASGLSQPGAIAVDAAGNVFVEDEVDIVLKEIVAAGGYQTVKTLGAPFIQGPGLTIDHAGNLFYSSGSQLIERTVSSGYAAETEIATGFTRPAYIAAGPSGGILLSSGRGVILVPVDSSATAHTLGFGSGNISNDVGGSVADSEGNVFLADTGNNAVEEILAAGGYTTVKTIGSGFAAPVHVALDKSGNLFVADAGNNAVKEVLAAGGYTAVTTIGSGFNAPQGVAVDAAGNVYVADTGNNAVKEVLAAGGYQTIHSFGQGFGAPNGVAVDASGNVFVTDPNNNAVKEILAAPPVTLASVLPGSRSVTLGSAATVFATMINAGAGPLQNCRIALPPTAPTGLALSYQTTDAATNALTGTPNTPVAIPGNNGTQSFVLAFSGTSAFNYPAMPLSFGCDAAPPAAILLGVNTIDLAMSSSAGSDIIALAATPTHDGIVSAPVGGPAAFAMASVNLGTAGAITVSVDTGDASLPIEAAICQTDQTTGACLAPPVQSFSMDFAVGAEPTFSVFFIAQGPIALEPGSSRLFVRFSDPTAGSTASSTSVAVKSP